ncbi:phospholipase C type enzyme [Mortierella polycephala]|uniref:Phospholipase C type enzyme n=1 Tax=Mortierella polycephala TaxID=41804 RepID=A0A9P6Q2Z2_9FUNG|nr:phospholipase C type enzyme [Mortierella polycephala]
MSKHRQDRISAIGQYLSNPSRGYDVVGLQEVWFHDDFLLIRDMVKQTFPFAKHWASGLFGSGLVILSRYPIVSTTMKRFALNGDPAMVLHGDWFDGKGCASAIIHHPLVGEIQVLNTHFHATYDPVGTKDTYLSYRLAQAWEMASLLQTALGLGRHVIALGDFNSAPDSLVVNFLRKYVGMTDSWGSLHPVPQNPIPQGLSPEEGVALLGITCDTPLNSWTRNATWKNQLSLDPIGERLDYIFYKTCLEMECVQAQVVLQEMIAEHGRSKASAPMKAHVSDHFAVCAVFSMKPKATYKATQQGPMLNHGGNDKNPAVDELLKQMLLTLRDGWIQSHTKRKWAWTVTTVFLIYMLLSINQKMNRTFLIFTDGPMLLIVLSSICTALFCYGFFYGGDCITAYTNIIQEIELALQYHDHHIMPA